MTQLFGVRYLCRTDEEEAYNPIDLAIRENPMSGMHGDLLKDGLAALGTLRKAMWVDPARLRSLELANNLELTDRSCTS